MSSFWCSITGADVMSWVVIVGMAGLIYLGFHRHQLAIARHTILRTLEEDIGNIFREKSAQIAKSSNKDESREFRSILDNKPPWFYEPDADAEPVAGYKRPVSRFTEGQRHWRVRRIEGPEGVQEQYIASRALQETLLWFRRVAKAHKDSVVKNDDLADLWRFTLPFGFAGRPQYFSQYFQGEEDIEAMLYVINATLRYCYDKRRIVPLRYFTQFVLEEDKQILARGKAFSELHASINVLVKKLEKQENLGGY